MKLTCRITGHKWKIVHDVDVIGKDDSGDPIFGEEYPHHYWCTKCDRVKGLDGRIWRD